MTCGRGLCLCFEDIPSVYYVYRNAAIDVDFVAPGFSVAVQHACRVRAFAGWPGTWALFSWGDGGESEARKVKLITTAVGEASARVGTDRREALAGERQVRLRGDALELTCADGSTLRVLELQPLNKKPMTAKAFANGLRGEEMTWVELEPVEEAVEG